MGKRFKAIDVISMSIAWLVDDMVTAGGKTVASGLDKHDFHIVLTVPAIWSDAAKQFMREAAIKKPVTNLYNLFLRPMVHFASLLNRGQLLRKRICSL